MVEHRNLKAYIKNFGPVREGRFELKPLTIFIGGNNSGKSYTAYLVYLLCRLLTGRGERLFNVPPVFRQHEYFQTYRQDFEAWLRVVYRPAGSEEKSWVNVNIELPPYLQEIFHRGFSKVLTDSNLGEDFKYAIFDYFGCRDVKELILDRASEESFSVQLNKVGKGAPLVAFAVGSNQDNPTVRGKISSIDSLRLPIDFIYNELIREGGDFLTRFVMVSWWALLEANGIPLNVYCLPAARSGIFQGWQALMAMSLRMLRWRFGLERFEVPLFTGVVGDFLQLLSEVLLNRQPLHSIPAHAALEVLEDNLFRGEVYIERMPQGTPLIFYKAGNLGLPLEHTSSLVGELAPLDLWIKYVLSPHDLLIIDEPEAHLHPEAQRMIARVLVRLVRAGIRVLCTTQSSIMLHQVSNHLRAAAADPETCRKLGFTEDDLLKPESLGVYLFARREGGTHIKSVPIDPGFGISEDEFARVTEEIGEEAQLLSLARHKRSRRKTK